MTRIAIILLSLAFSAGTVAAQSSRDSTRAPDGSSEAPAQAYGDSASRVAADTGRPISADSTRTDSVRASSARPDSTPASASSAAPIPPVKDSSLVSACRPTSSGAVGGVLLVIFTGDATAADKQRAVKAIGGWLAGEAPTGGDYVAVPDTMSARNAADLLIQQPGISQISERSC